MPEDDRITQAGEEETDISASRATVAQNGIRNENKMNSGVDVVAGLQALENRLSLVEGTLKRGNGHLKNVERAMDRFSESVESVLRRISISRMAKAIVTVRSIVTNDDAGDGDEGGGQGVETRRWERERTMVDWGDMLDESVVYPKYFLNQLVLHPPLLHTQTPIGQPLPSLPSV